MRRLGKINNQNGAAMVEFAIVLPLLLILIFGMIEFSVMFYDKAMLTNATREGARLGILYNSPDRITEAQITQTINGYLQNNLISFDGNADWSYLPPDTPLVTCTDSDMLTVSITYPYKFLVLPNFITSLAPTLTLGATTTMRCE